MGIITEVGVHLSILSWEVVVLITWLMYCLVAVSVSLYRISIGYHSEVVGLLWVDRAVLVPSGLVVLYVWYWNCAHLVQRLSGKQCLRLASQPGKSLVWMVSKGWRRCGFLGALLLQFTP